MRTLQPWNRDLEIEGSLPRSLFSRLILQRLVGSAHPTIERTLQIMPANLPPEYYKLKHQLEAAKTDDERLQLMEEMLRITPKHKGSEKVVSDLRRRIAKLRNAPDKKSGTKRHSHHIPKQGAGQIVLLGAPNVGKSRILASFTNARPEVSHTPFSTREPGIGMLNYGNIQFQLIDTPPMTADFVQPETLDLARNADMLLIVVNLGGDEVLDEVEIVTSKLQAAKIPIGGEVHNGEIEETDSPSGTGANRLGLIVANQMDDANASDRLEILKEFYADSFRICPLSAATGDGREHLEKTIYDKLEILRVYTKTPGKRVDRDDPLVLPIGSTVIDAAMELHRDFAANLKFARAWGVNWHDGQSVSRDDNVHDGDILEFHI